MTKKLSLNQLENELGEYRKFVEMFDASEAVLSEVDKAVGMVRFIFDHAQIPDEVTPHTMYFETGPNRKKRRKYINNAELEQFLSLMNERDDKIFTRLDMIEYFGCSHQHTIGLTNRLTAEGKIKCLRRKRGIPNLYSVNG